MQCKLKYDEEIKQMKYETKKQAERKIARAHELVDLWIKCNIPAQFWLHQPIEVPDTTVNEL